MHARKFNSGIEEYKYFLLNYLLPIIGISYNNNLLEIDDENHHSGTFIRQETNQIIFSAFDRDVFSLQSKQILSNDAIALGRKIIPAFFSVSRFKMSGSFRARNIDYPSDVIHEENLRHAIQKGVCDWCLGTDNSSFYCLLQILEQWAVQTYEGKKVTFGFIINPNSCASFAKDYYGTWMDFLKDDYAATLSDCIHSAIELDKECNFSRYLSITDGNSVDAYTLPNLLPYRFAPIIEKYVKGSCVGVFLLNNGDIILSKSRSICLIKRNLKWLNLSYNAFNNALRAKLDSNKSFEISDELLQQVYASTLDVSFSHTGGIIAVVAGVSDLLETRSEKPVLNACDNLLNIQSLEEIESSIKADQSNKGLSNQEINKRLLKRKAIISLVGGKKFSEIDRKLRAELISMDGACILDSKGEVCAFGAIIQNDSGSSGGGRSAAAKKLSYHGMAVKISTDGYMELYVDGEPIYAIK